MTRSQDITRLARSGTAAVPRSAAPERHYSVAMVVNGADAMPAIASFVDGLQARLTSFARIGG